jgi:hypothetical protein
VDRTEGLGVVPGTLPVSRLIEVADLTPDDVTDAVATVSPEHVLSFSELHLALAARVRERLGLPGEPSAVEDLIRDKGATRQRLADQGLSTVRSAVTTLADLPRTAASFPVPFVVKPVDMTGSIGVRAVRDHAEVSSYADLFDDARAEQDRGRRLLLEEFVPGTEYSVEGICLAGTFHLLAVTQKETSGFPSFYETGHVLPARAQRDDPRFSSYIQDVVGALGIGTAPIHAEVKVTSEATRASAATSSRSSWNEPWTSRCSASSTTRCCREKRPGHRRPRTGSRGSDSSAGPPTAWDDVCPPCLPESRRRSFSPARTAGSPTRSTT